MKKHLTLLALFLVFSGFSQDTGLLTHYEKSDFQQTATYDEVISYSKMIAAISPRISYQTFGTSPQGRELPLLILDREGLSSPAGIHASGRAVLLIEAGIHPGEADGTDAALMFARDVAVNGKLEPLLENLTILIIPAFNVDGLARFGPFNRINQNGPEEMGWRVNAQNLNLNRDFLKADSPEIQAWLKLFNTWLPDFFIDCHTTDGADYQYVATYVMELFGNMDPALTRWQEDDYLPYMIPKMNQSGYPVFPYVSFRRWHDPRSGLVSDAAPPRLSQGYTAIQNRPGLLIETHMLKPHRIRVEGTYHLLEFTAEYLNLDYDRLKKLIKEADEFTALPAFRKEPFPLRFRHDDTDSTLVEFQGVEYTIEKSELTGGNWFKYSKTPETFILPWFHKPRVIREANLPEAYIIPPEWLTVIDRLLLHGAEIRRLAEPAELEITSCHFENPQWSRNPVEGRHVLTDFKCQEIQEKRVFPAGSAIVDMNQRAARVIAHILEPQAPDAFLYWGFFDAIFEQKEYSETYVMEVVARELLGKDPALKEEFDRKKAEDPNFAGNQWVMLNWFYSKTPYWDWKKDKYPVGRIYNRNLIEQLKYQ